MVGEGGLIDPVAEVRRRADIPPGPLVVALSGGADSAVCAWAARDATEDVRAVFVDHGFDESPSMAAAAQAVAARVGIDLRRVSVVVPAGASPEGRARSVRLAALEGELEPGETLLSGHTADDQAETVLGNLLRGAGAAGVAGIPRRRGRWARPLLDVDRETVRAAAAALRLPFADDPTNDSLDPTRNRIRHEVLPRLGAFNPELVATLARTAALAAADDDVLGARADAVPLIEGDLVVKVPAAALTTLPPAVASRVARRALRTARGPHAGSAAEVEAVVAAASGHDATIGGAIEVRREGPWVTLAPRRGGDPRPVPLSVPGVTRFWAGEIDATAGTPRWRPLGPQVTTVPAGMPLEVVAASPGDRISFGGGSKTVGAALAEAGVPVRLRERWPAVAGRGIIHWIVGVRSAPAPEGPAVTLTVRLEEQ